jgi:tetratricopeptide (TPR) repeat protein/mono/diheme cytochrome c family protein
MLAELGNGPMRGGARRALASAAALVGLLAATSPGAMAGSAPAQRPATPPSAVDAREAVTFSRDIAPLFFAHCATCHRPGTAAPFSLLTYHDARPWARAIKQATSTRSMPPWKPEPGYGGPFLGDRRLTDAQIDLIARWVDAGALAGSPADLPPPPPGLDGWRLGAPDLVIEMPEPFLLRAAGDDVFRKFVIPIPISETRFVEGLEFQPAVRGAGSSSVPNPRVIHHANMRLDPTPASRTLDARDPEPGFDDVTPFDAQFPAGHLLGWTPGQDRPLVAEGMAWRLDAGTDLLLELHLMPSGQPEIVQSRIGLYFTDEPPTKTPFTIRLGKQDLDIPPGATDYRSRDRYVLPVDVEVHGIHPHAHYLAREVRARATLPDGTSRWLLYIEDWDASWQDYYFYAEPFLLPRGTELSMEFRFDNSAGNRRNPHFPPRRVAWGPRSSNTMGDVSMQVVARSAADREILAADRRPLEMAEDIVGFEIVLEAEPDNVTVHDDVARLYLLFGKVEEALAHFRESVRLQPGSPAAQYNVGTTLLQLGELDQAVAHFERALDLDPDYAPVHNNLGAALRSQGRLEEAILRFRRAVRARPDDEDALYNLASTLTLRGEFTEAIALYRQVLGLLPDSPEPFAELAWILATQPEPSAADVQQAARLAGHAAQLTGRRDARVLNTLAAAHAAAGRFDEAAATARAALALLGPGGSELETAIRRLLDLYTEGRRYRRPR